VGKKVRETRIAVLKGFSRYEVLETGIVRYRESGKICPDYDDGKNGYRKIKLYPDGVKKRKIFFVHRLVWEAFNGSIPPGLEVDHSDGVRLNNSLDNLVLATHKQNCILKKQRENNLFSRQAPKKGKKVG